MKKIVALAILVVSSFIDQAVAAELKVGHVDFRVLVYKSPQYTSVQEKLRKEFKERGESLEAMLKDREALVQKAQKEAATLSQDQKIDMSRQVTEKEAAIKLKKKAFDEDFQRRQAEETKILQAQVLAAVDAYAKEHKYSMIANRQSLVWADPALDITQQVLAKLNASAGK